MLLSAIFFALGIVSLLLIIVVLMQDSKGGGLSTAFGGGGGDTGAEGEVVDPFGGAGGDMTGEEGAGGSEGPVDSRRDDWARMRQLERKKLL